MVQSAIYIFHLCGNSEYDVVFTPVIGMCCVFYFIFHPAWNLLALSWCGCQTVSIVAPRFYLPRLFSLPLFLNCSGIRGQLQRNHLRSRIELQRGWIWIWQEAIPISNSTMKKWSRCIRKDIAAERLEKSLDLQKNRLKNVWEGQDAKPGKSRNVFQNNVGGQQSKYQPHCQHWKKKWNRFEWKMNCCGIFSKQPKGSESPSQIRGHTKICNQVSGRFYVPLLWCITQRILQLPKAKQAVKSGDPFGGTDSSMSWQWKIYVHVRLSSGPALDRASIW